MLQPLQKLEVLQLSHNRFTGPIPYLFNPYLRTLNVSYNFFQGRPLTYYSKYFVYINDIEILDLSYNEFTGDIVDTISIYLKQLVVFCIDGNHFSDLLPTKRLSHWASTLQVFSASKNELIGSISEDFGLLTSLQELRLSENLITGTLPTALGNLTTLEVLEIHNNNLDGTIPKEFLQLSSLERATFQGNNFQGELDFLCAMLPSVDPTPDEVEAHTVLISADCSGSSTPEITCSTSSCCECF